MLRKCVFFVLGLALTSCVSNESQITEVLKKNPKIIFDLIEENPEKFIEVVNNAAQKAQQKNYEKQISDSKAEQYKDFKNPKKPKIDIDRRLFGSDESSITIVEYADFQCPACRMAYKTLNQFKEKYKTKVQFYYKHLPLDFHKMAYPAAVYFEAVKAQDSAKALKFYNYVFENQKQISDSGFLDKAARQVGIDMKILAKDIKSEKIKKIIADDSLEFQNFGFTGTPVILINGVALHGAQPLEEMERILNLK